MPDVIMFFLLKKADLSVLIPRKLTGNLEILMAVFLEV